MRAVYIDAQNVHRKTIDNNRRINWQRLFVYLCEKYKIDVIYYAVGYVKKYEKLYNMLERIWYTMLYKETIILSNGEIKGNVDIDIAIRCILDMCRCNLQKAYLITNDWDYNTLMKTLIEEGIFWWLIVADDKSISQLLKKFDRTILDLQYIREKICL